MAKNPEWRCPWDRSLIARSSWREMYINLKTSKTEFRNMRCVYDHPLLIEEDGKGGVVVTPLSFLAPTGLAPAITFTGAKDYVEKPTPQPIVVHKKGVSRDEVTYPEHSGSADRTTDSVSSRPARTPPTPARRSGRRPLSQNGTVARSGSAPARNGQGRQKKPAKPKPTRKSARRNRSGTHQ